MELLEMLNEDGSGAGVYKDRADVHREGDLHGSSHVWIVRDLIEGNFSVLLQRRSANKDAFPHCLDTSCSGHVATGETFYSAALRELDEELGIKLKKDLMFMFDHTVLWEAEFHGKKFINHEICRVYLLQTLSVDLNAFQKEEISALCWQDAQTLLAALQRGDSHYCIQLSLFEKFVEKVTQMRLFTIHISDYWSMPDAGSDEWTYHKTYTFFGTEEAAIERAKKYVQEFYEEVSPYLASVTYWLT
jgi:8-oxo-dGTP diphosphatase